MTMTRESAHWRVDLVTDSRAITVAWFVRRYQAEAYAEDYVGSKLIVVDLTPAPQATAVELQRGWIAEHGGTKAAYIQRYGDPELSRCYGNGGTAIFEADAAELRRLIALTR